MGDKGYNVIELLVATVVGTIVLGLTGSLVFSHMGQLARTREKLEMNSTQIEIQRALLDPGTCIANLAPVIIDETRIGQANYTVNLNRLVARGAGTDVIVQVGNFMGGLAPNLSVNAITAQNFVKVRDNRYKFDLHIAVLNALNEISVMRILRVRVSTDPSSPTAAKVPVDCGFTTSTPRNCRMVQNTPSNNGKAIASCAPGELLATGGGECLTAGGAPLTSPYPPPADSGYLYISAPIILSGVSGWEADCYNNPTSNTVRARAYAYCCNRL